MLVPDGMLQALSNTPTLTLKTTRGTKQAYDIPGLVALLAPYAGLQSRGIIAEAHGHAWPRNPQHVYHRARIWRLAGRSGRLGAGPIPASALTSGNVPWGWRAIKSRHAGGRCSSTRVLTYAYANIMGEPRRSCWRGMAGGVWPQVVVYHLVRPCMTR